MKPAHPDVELPPLACVAVLPVDVDDRTAPLGCSALRRLAGRPLLAWAVESLLASRVPRAVVLAVAPPLEEAAARAVPPAGPPGHTGAGDAGRTLVHVVPLRAPGPGHRLLAALNHPAGARSGTDAPGRAEDLVVVHDPLHPLSSAALVRQVVRELLACPDAAASAPARAVTDTLKWVDDDEVVLDTADRETYRMVYSPQAYRRGALLAALEAADDDALRAHGPEVLPRLVQARGERVLLVPSMVEAFRVSSDDDLMLAEALLHVGADGAGPPGSGA